MTYYADLEKELSYVGIQPGEAALYTGTAEKPGLWDGPKTMPYTRNVYVYFWEGGKAREVDKQFEKDSADRRNREVLDFHAGKDHYIFLRDYDECHLWQVYGPAKPVVVANLGAVPLRVDTFLGKFEVHCGGIRRLDGSARQRSTKKVLLSFDAKADVPLKGAMAWEEGTLRTLNVLSRTAPPMEMEEDGRRFSGMTQLILRDGNAAVQRLSYNSGRRESFYIYLEGAVNPDYEIYFTTTPGSAVEKIQYYGSPQLGKIAACEEWEIFLSVTQEDEPMQIYDFQKIQQAPLPRIMQLCTAEVRGFFSPLAAAAPGSSALEGVCLAAGDLHSLEPADEAEDAGIPVDDIDRKDLFD